MPQDAQPPISQVRKDCEDVSLRLGPVDDVNTTAERSLHLCRFPGAMPKQHQVNGAPGFSQPVGLSLSASLGSPLLYAISPDRRPCVPKWACAALGLEISASLRNGSLPDRRRCGMIRKDRANAIRPGFTQRGRRRREAIGWVTPSIHRTGAGSRR